MFEGVPKYVEFAVLDTQRHFWYLVRIGDDYAILPKQWEMSQYPSSDPSRTVDELPDLKKKKHPLLKAGVTHFC